MRCVDFFCSLPRGEKAYKLETLPRPAFTIPAALDAARLRRVPRPAMGVASPGPDPDPDPGPPSRWASLVAPTAARKGDSISDEVDEALPSASARRALGWSVPSSSTSSSPVTLISLKSFLISETILAAGPPRPASTSTSASAAVAFACSSLTTSWMSTTRARKRSSITTSAEASWLEDWRERRSAASSSARRVIVARKRRRSSAPGGAPGLGLGLGLELGAGRRALVSHEVELHEQVPYHITRLQQAAHDRRVGRGTLLPDGPG
eukprot:scaffold41641_cov63-Phaeocystis_antarctica.AAC.2